jgi:hypothetical protein
VSAGIIAVRNAVVGPQGLEPAFPAGISASYEADGWWTLRLDADPTRFAHAWVAIDGAAVDPAYAGKVVVVVVSHDPGWRARLRDFATSSTLAWTPPELRNAVSGAAAKVRTAWQALYDGPAALLGSIAGLGYQGAAEEVASLAEI